MAAHNINGIRIHTSFDYPPIPDRRFDWSAVDDNYDCDCDQDGFFSTCPIGHGATEQEAIADLLEQIAERAEDASERVVLCECCGSEGTIYRSTYQSDEFGNEVLDANPCDACEGEGVVTIATHPITIDDLPILSGDAQ